MAGLHDIKRRIVSVRNTQKITRAMKMVAASKLRRAQEAILQARPYAHRMRDLVNNLAEALGVYGDGQIPATFVTREGDVLSPDGVIRGGGESVGSGMLGRVREVRELKVEVSEIALQLEAVDQTHMAAEVTLQRSGEELDNLRNRHHTAALALANHEKDLDRTRERVKSLGEAREVRVAENAYQEVVEVVGYAAGQLPDGLHFLGLAELVLDFTLLGNILGDPHQPHDFLPITPQWQSGIAIKPRFAVPLQHGKFLID